MGHSCSYTLNNALFSHRGSSRSLLTDRRYGNRSVGQSMRHCLNVDEVNHHRIFTFLICFPAVAEPQGTLRGLSKCSV